MAENYALTGFKEIGRGIGQFCADNKAHILTGLSVVGTVTTGVLSARAGARSARKIDRREEELGRRLTPGEKMKLCGTDYIAPAASGIVAICGAVGSDVINTQTIARTNLALIASEKAYEALNRKTREVLGDKKARQVRDEIAKEHTEQAQANPQTQIITPYNLENAPKSGNGPVFPYVDDYSQLLMWTNPDYLNLMVHQMRDLMNDLAPRGDEMDYYDKIVGVAYSEFLRRMNFEPRVCNAAAFTKFGWNKGFNADGTDDDPIEYFTTTMEYSPGFPVNVISWEKLPTDLRLGRLLKSQGM